MKTNITKLLIAWVLITTLLLTGCKPRPVLGVGELQTESQTVELGDTKSVSVKIKMGAGDLNVNGGAEKLLGADFTYNVAELKPEVKFTGGAVVIWEPGNKGQIDWRGSADFRNEWDLHLNNDVPMDLRLDLGAGNSDLNLNTMSLTRLAVKLGAGTSTIDLSGAWVRDLDVTINSGAADITVRLPKDIGVRVEVDRGPTLVDAPHLEQDENIYTNAAYGVSDVTLHINMEAGIGQIHLEVDDQTGAESALQTFLDEQVDNQHILGMVMSERLADGTVIWDTSGTIDPSGSERWSPTTASLIASVTKTFTAVVVMQLVEEGKLSLDDRVDTWFPEQPNGDKITVRMLLSHTSGLANYSKTFGMDIDKWTREWTPEELIDVANKVGPVGEPGSHAAHYSNTNYIMLGLIIEKITGNSWEHEVEARIIQPLALKDTTFGKEDTWKTESIPGFVRTADGYLSSYEFPWYPHSSTAWAAGGIISTVSDLMTFASALFDGRLVSSETLAIMVQPMGSEGNREWGLGGGVVDIDGQKAFGMGGDTTGYHAFFIGIPDTKLVVTALVNTEQGDVISPSITALEYLSQQDQK